MEQNVGLRFPVLSFTSGFNSPKHIIMQLLVVGNTGRMQKKLRKIFKGSEGFEDQVNYIHGKLSGGISKVLQ